MRAAIVLAIVVLLTVGLWYFVPTGEAPRDDRYPDPYVSDYELSEEARAHLWKVEQQAFLLATEATPVLGRALRAGDKEPWLAIFAEDASTSMPSEEPEHRVHGMFTRVRWESAGRTGTAADFLDWLWAIRGEFTEFDRVSVHQDRLVMDRGADTGFPAYATWTITLEGRTAAGFRSTAILWEMRLRSIPEQGAGQGWVYTLRTLWRTDLTAPQRAYEDVTAKSGIDTSELADLWGYANRDEAPANISLNTYLLDYDRDGVLDILFTDRKLTLYRGRGDGTFENTTRAAGVESYRAWSVFGATVIDVDNDGDEDLLVDIIEGGRGANVAYENKGDGTFRRRADFVQLGVAVTNGAVADYDNDGRPDIYLRAAGERLSKEQQQPRWIGDRTVPEGVLLRNRGDWRFEDVTKAAGVETDHRDIFAAAWLDVEPDGDPDLLLANHMGENLLFVNRGDGTFDFDIIAKDFGGFSMGVAIGDLDEDGDPDAYLANMSSSAGDRIIGNLREHDYPPGVFPLINGFIQGNVVLRNDGTKLVELDPQTAGWAYGPAVTDFDGDGRPDLYCPAGFQSVKRGEPDG